MHRIIYYYNRGQQSFRFDLFIVYRVLIVIELLVINILLYRVAFHTIARYSAGTVSGKYYTHFFVKHK